MIRGRHNENLSRGERCQKFTIKADLYKQPFRLLLPDEKDEYRTFAGSILTICTFIVVLIYATIKLQILFGYEDYKVQISEYVNFYAETDRFTHLDGFAVAAGIWTGDGDVLPLNVGQLKFYRKQWSAASNTIDFAEI